MDSETYQADVIVVGGGLAGITTTLELLAAGRSVLLLDRDEESEFGGLANWAFGGMFFVDSLQQRKSGIRDSVDLALRDWMAYAEFGSEDYWPKKWAEQFVHLCTSEVQEWLAQKGVSWFRSVNWTERGLFQPGNSVPRFHLTWGTSKALVQNLIQRLRSHTHADRLQLQFRRRVLELETEAGKLKGVKGINEKSGKPFHARAEVVVAAAGGINGSIEKVKANWYRAWGAPPAVILNGSHPYAVGDLHEATRKINGNITNLGWMWNYAAGIRHPQARYPNHGLSLVPCKSALWLNYKGERMGPLPLVSAYDTRYLVERICQEEKKYSWQVLNLKIAYKEFTISGSEHNPAVRDQKLFSFLKGVLFGRKDLVDDMLKTAPDMVAANSIEELAEKMNALTGEQDVDRALLQDSIRRYDAMIERGPKYFNDDQLRRIAQARRYLGDRLRTAKFQKIEDLKAMPLIAIREFILSRKSLGGIQTDLSCRVLTTPVGERQEVIPGLYAVGESAGFGGGGMHGLRSLEGTFLSGCVLTGRLAAKSIVEQWG